MFGDDDPPAVMIPAPPPGMGEDLPETDGSSAIPMPPPGEANGVEDEGDLLGTDTPAPPHVMRSEMADGAGMNGDLLGDDDVASAPPPPVMVGGGDVDEDDDDDEYELPARPATPDAIKQWRVDFARGIEEKQAHEKKVQAERKEQATKIIRNMHSKWNDRCSSNKKINLDYEKKFLKERDALQAKFSREGSKPNWNIIPELANMSAEFKKGQRDTSRMREVIMKLKT